MSRPLYLCHLCDAKFYDLLEVINIFSVEGKQLKAAAKIFFVLSIMIVEDDPTPKFICRPCFGQIEVNVRFAHKSRMTHYKHMKNSMNLPNNHNYKDEVGALLGMPIHSLFYRHFSSLEDLQGMYDALIKFMKNADIRNQPVEDRLGFYDNIFNRKNSTSSVNSENQLSIIENVLPVGNNSLTNGHSTNGVRNRAGTHLDLGRTNIPEAIPSLQENSHRETQPVTPVTRRNSVRTRAGTHLDLGRTNIPEAITSLQENSHWEIQPVIPVTSTNGVRNRAGTHLDLGRTNIPEAITSLQENSRWEIQPVIPVTDNTRNNLNNRLVKRNTRIKKSPIPNIILRNLKSNHVKPNSNIQNIAIDPIEEEIICLDDDDDDDDDRNDTTEIQPVRENSDTQTPPIPPINNLSNINKKKVLNCTNMLNFKRKLVHQSNSSPLHSRTEEISVTPDLPMPDTDVNLLINPVNPVYYNNIVTSPVVSPINRSPLVTPETGFHFLYKSDQTVDLTRSDNPQQKKPMKYKRKHKNPENLQNQSIHPKKIQKKNICVPASSETTDEMMQPSTSKTITKEHVTNGLLNTHLELGKTNKPEATKPLTKKKRAVKPIKKIGKLSLISSSKKAKKLSTSKTIASEQSIPKPRPKRASAVAPSVPESDNRLGKHKQGEWKILVENLDILLYTCPICKIIFAELEDRMKHEKNTHKSFRLQTNSPDDCNSTLVNTIDVNKICEQQEFLSYFNIVKQNSLKQTPIDRILSRKNFAKALKYNGINDIGKYKCYYCDYETCRIFILSAHIYSRHIPLYSEKKCGDFCFSCNRALGKRSNLLKHMENCSMNRDANKNGTRINEKLSCHFCDTNIVSIEHLEKHLLKHVTS